MDVFGEEHLVDGRGQRSDWCEGNRKSKVVKLVDTFFFFFGVGDVQGTGGWRGVVTVGGGV